jgi:hypothetical protein
MASLPVPTSVLGRYHSVVAVVLYALCMAIVGLLTFSLWWYAAANYRLIDASLDAHIIFDRSIGLLIAPTIFLLSIGVAFINIFAPALPGPDLAEYFWLLIAVAQYISGHKRRPEKPARA